MIARGHANEQAMTCLVSAMLHRQLTDQNPIRVPVSLIVHRGSNIIDGFVLCGTVASQSERSSVRIPLTPFQILGKFVYPMLPNGMLLVYPKRMAIKPCPHLFRSRSGL